MSGIQIYSKNYIHHFLFSGKLLSRATTFIWKFFSLYLQYMRIQEEYLVAIKALYIYIQCHACEAYKQMFHN